MEQAGLVVDGIGLTPQAEKRIVGSTTRPRDVIFDALVSLFGLHPEVNRGMLNKAVQQFRLLEATPAEIEFRRGVYIAKWPDCTCSPLALAQWWGQMREMPKAKGAQAVNENTNKLTQQSLEWNDREVRHRTDAIAQMTADTDWCEALDPITRETLEKKVAGQAWMWGNKPASKTPMGRAAMRAVAQGEWL